MKRLLVIVAVVAAFLMSLVGLTAPTSAAPVAGGAGVASAAPAAKPPAQAPRLNWSPCYKKLGADTGVAYQCATLQVPLDHDQPQGTSLQVAVVKVPARDQGQRIGSLVLNPGGPGGSGVDFALFAGPFAEALWGPEVADRFDIVGFDPRGILRSSPLRCFGNLDQASAAFAPMAFPTTPEEEAIWGELTGILTDRCDQSGGRIADHMSTANVARDMDLLRAGLGDEQLTYYGVSYGSYLGVTYANLFPDRVRSLVVDAVLDPIAWVNEGGEVPFSTALRSDHGARTTLDRFFDLCEAAAPGNCAFAPGSAARFDALATSLEAEPLVFVDPETGETFQFTYADLIGSMLGPLYDAFSYHDAALFLATLEQLAAGAEPSAEGLALTHGYVAKRTFPHYLNWAEGFPGVACADTDNPDDLSVWSTAGIEAENEFGYFGRLWTWVSSACAEWPAQDGDRFVGPFTAHTANPVLVVGNLYDPATRYEGAQTVRGLLPNSALVTVDLPGHGALGASACATAHTSAYLLDPTTAADAFCGQEFNPFDLMAGLDPTAASVQLGLAPEPRARLMTLLQGDD